MKTINIKIPFIEMGDTYVICNNADITIDASDAKDIFYIVNDATVYDIDEETKNGHYEAIPIDKTTIFSVSDSFTDVMYMDINERLSDGSTAQCKIVLNDVLLPDDKLLSFNIITSDRYQLIKDFLDD